MLRGVLLVAGLLSGTSLAFAADHQEFKKTPLAEVFGTLPAMHGVRMAPDGTKISFLTDAVDGETDAVVFDISAGKLHGVGKSKFGEFTIDGCRWANNERLLCMIYGVDLIDRTLTPYTRLLAVNYDGTQQKSLTRHRQADTQFASTIVDMLPDEPNDVLLSQFEGDSMLLEHVDIYTNKSKTIASGSTTISGWMTDGHGKPRLRLTKDKAHYRWDYVLAGSDDWKELYEHKIANNDDEDDKQYLSPAGFGDNPNILYYFKPQNGRRALWQRDLTASGAGADKLVFARPDVDVDDLATIGKYGRAYAVDYTTDSSHMKMFDARIENVLNALSATMPGKEITVYDESWDRRYYLVKVSGDDDPGYYYRLDFTKRQLLKMSPSFPKLEGRQLAKMRSIEYKATDGTTIPAYLTTPPGKDAKNLPLVVLPHGGPSSRDEWGFDPLVQYVVAKGFAVLQSNYRGSGGYGDDWEGRGGFKEWRQVVSDLTDGAKALIADGVADPNRLCMLGWSYGGYASLMSVIENKTLYKCAVSIAGVTDPEIQIREEKKYTDYYAARDFMGGGNADVIKAGSPLHRVGEINVPVLMFHGTKDVNVAVRNSERLADALRDKGKSVDYVEYENAEHDIWRSSYRIDMLARIGAFLDRYIGKEAR